MAAPRFLNYLLEQKLHQKQLLQRLQSDWKLPDLIEVIELFNWHYGRLDDLLKFIDRAIEDTGGLYEKPPAEHSPS
jgi:hypothetical protein